MASATIRPLGKAQQSILLRFLDHDVTSRDGKYPYPGIARSAWLLRVLSSLERRGLVERHRQKNFDDDTRLMGVWEDHFTLTDAGRAAAEALRPKRARGIAALIPSNPTLRQSAHVARSMRDKQLRDAETEAHNSGVLTAADRGENDLIDEDAIVGEARNAAAEIDFRLGLSSAAELDVVRWLTRVWLAGYFAQAAAQRRRRLA